MHNKKLILLIIPILMVILIPFILYGLNFNLIAFDGDLYKKEFSKYSIYSQLSGYDIEDTNNEVLDYLRADGNELIGNNFFNEREKQHLLDVKNLIQKVFAIYHFSIVLFLILAILLFLLLNFNLKIFARKLLIILVFGSLLTFLDAALFYLLSDLSFNFIFDLFHKTFFASGTYTFNPQSENIVVLYPENLFFDFLVEIISGAILSSIILIFISLSFLFVFFKKKFPKFPVNLSSEKTKKQKV